jgi:beta-N-acetylhexosaminidase
LEAVEFLPFRAAIDANVGVMMVSHIWFTQLESDPIPASLSPRIVQGLLRDDMGYDGVIMTDALDMDAIDTVYSAGESAIQAILAGNDLIAIGAHVGTATIEIAIDEVVAAVQGGVIAEQQIDASVERILRLKQDYGVLDWSPLPSDTVSERLNLDAHDALVTDVFKQGVTVIGADGMIPVQGAVTVVYLATRPRIVEECSGFAGETVYLGVSATPSDDERNWAVTASANADTVVVFTQNAVDNPQQRALVDALPPEKTIVAALWDTSDMLMFPNVAGYMLGYSPMLKTTAVICDILAGRQDAMGTFPITFGNN